jgi:CBS domain containing-hemolysin-like protein
MNQQLLLIACALLLVALNGFFVAAEFAIVKLRATRIAALAKAHGWRGQVLRRVHAHLDAYLSACQLGITLASLGLGWIGEPAFARLLEPVFALAGIADERVIRGTAFFVAFLMISFLHIVIGEQAPKVLAIRRSEQVGLWTAVPLYAFYYLMYPAIWLLNRSSNWVLRKTRLDGVVQHEEQYSVAELKMILRSSRAGGGFTAEERRVISQALDFRDLEVADLMRPFGEAVTLSAQSSVEDNLAEVMRHRYSWYPYVDDGGRVIGMIHLKDLLPLLRNGPHPASLDHLLHPVARVAPSMRAIELMRHFRHGNPHFALIAFEDGQPQAFVTLDNLLDALIGEMQAERGARPHGWTKRDDGSLVGNAAAPIYTLERALGVEIEDPEADDATSVGGLILQRLGDLPKEGQRVSFRRFDAVVQRMEGPRIHEVSIHPARETEVA